MEGEYLNDCLSIDTNDDKEKSKIAEVAAVTLCRLNNIMKQMKDWRDDRVKLRSNIWRLKLALRVGGRETDDILHADPLIEHQRAEIKRLEAANQALKKEIADIKTTLIEEDYATADNARKTEDKHFEIKQKFSVEKERLHNEIFYLKRRLKEVEEGHEDNSEVEHLKCKLQHFIMVDHTMEIIFTDIVNRVAETIANLSEELVNVSEHLQMCKLKNDNLYVKVDKLKSMLRSKNGETTDYQKRIVELDNLASCLKSELCVIKVNLEDKSWNKTSDHRNNLRNAERLMNDLKNKLKNDRNALLASGDPDCLRYIKKLVELRVNLKELHVELAKSTVSFRSQCSEKTVEYNKYAKQISILECTFKEINVEIDKLKDEHVMKHCKFGDIEGLEYLKKIEVLRAIVEKAKETMNSLNRRTEGSSSEGEDIEKLEGFVDRVCQEIKQLEVIVASRDCSSLLKRIEQLEESIVLLKVKSNEKDERVNVMRQKLFDVEAFHEQRIKELKDTQRKVGALTEDNRILKGRTRKMEEKISELQHEHEENKTLKVRTKRMEEKISELQNEHDGSKRELEQLQQVRNEANVARKKLHNLQADKEGLLKEIKKIRDALQKRNEEIKLIVNEKDAMEKILNAKIVDMGKSLQVVSKEKVKLLSKLSDLERVERKLAESTNPKKESENTKRPQRSSENADVQLQQLKAESESLRESLNNANYEIIDLKDRLDHFSGDKARLEASVFHLESKKEMLVYQLDIEKSNAEGKLKELSKLTLAYGELDNERVNLKNEKEQLRMELTDLKIEKEYLKKSLEKVNAEQSKLEDDVNEYKSERSVLQEEIRNLKTTAENLASKLNDARGELNGAGDKIRRLEFENSKQHDSLNVLALKNTGFEGRVQVLLTEKNDLATRINELEGKNVALKDQLNKVKTENEYSAIELNKLRTECDKARSENTSLQNTLDETNESSQKLQKTIEELKMKLTEVHSEYRVVENQLRILEMTNASLKEEKETLYREYVSNLQSGVSKAGRENVIVDDVIFNERVKQIIECVMGRCESEIKWDNTKSSKRSNDRLKIKDSKNEMKKLIIENEALKFELLNLRSQNVQVKMELSRIKDEYQRQKLEFTQNMRNENAIRPVMNLYYKEINSYSGQYPDDNLGALACIDRASVCYGGSTMEQESGIEVERLLEIVNKLKIENVALKMELNTLRCNVVVNFAEDETRKNELRNALEEIRALKTELTKLRDERESLQVRLDTARAKLNQLESERDALKGELYVLRKTNSDLKRKANEFQCDYQKLKEKSVGFESRIMGTVKKIKKYTTNAESSNSIDDELKDLLKKLILNEELLHSMNEPETDFAEIYINPATM